MASGRGLLTPNRSNSPYAKWFARAQDWTLLLCMELLDMEPSLMHRGRKEVRLGGPQDLGPPSQNNSQSLFPYPGRPRTCSGNPRDHANIPSTTLCQPQSTRAHALTSQSRNQVQMLMTEAEVAPPKTPATVEEG